MIPVVQTKSASDDVASAFEDFARAFEAFKDANDTRLSEIETRLSGDVVTDEKLARIDTALDDAKRRLDRLSLDRSRPPLGRDADAARDPAKGEHKAAFHSYIRTGEAAGLKRLEEKALSAGSGPDGGYLVPDIVESEVLRRLSAVSPIRAISSVRVISGGQYKRAFSTTGPASGWVGETAARPQTASPTLSEMSFPAMELYAMPAATQTLLDDAVVDIDRWIAEEVEAAFAEQESTAFVNGDGVNKPKGFLDVDQVEEEIWEWGRLGTVEHRRGDLPGRQSVRRARRPDLYPEGGLSPERRFVMNRKTQSAIRRFKDDNGQYLWSPPASLGQSATLMGFPVVEAEDMPDIAANECAVAFGDFKRGYLIVDRAGMRVLRDPYSAKPYVLFYTTKRVGGGVQDYAAIKLLKFAA